jgi:hypothetical protein
VSLTADVTGTLPEGNGGTGITSLGSGIATWLGTPSSANLASALTDETGTGVAVFGTSPTFTTQITAPLLLGGTGTTSTLTLQTTSGVGTTGANFLILGGNNGATQLMKILNSGNTLIGNPCTNSGCGTQPLQLFHMVGTANGLIFSDHIEGNSTGTVFVMRKARGDLTTPTKTLSGDNLFQLQGRGWQDTTGAWTTVAAGVIGIQAVEDFTSTAQGTNFIVNVTPIGSVTPARQLTVTSAALTFGSMVTPASTGTRYLCISTTGVVTSSASACSGT